MQLRMKMKLTRLLHTSSAVLEFAIAAILLIWVLFLLFHMVLEHGGKAMAGEGVSFGQILSMCLDLVIGIEFTKMLCRHTPDTILDVLMFATARQAIIDHSRIVENLLQCLQLLSCLQSSAIF